MIKEFFKKHTPAAILPTARNVWNTIDLVRVRKNRSYLHGLLFDLTGKEYCTEGMTFQIAEDQFPRSYRSRLYFDIYEAPERKLVKKWVSKDAHVLELGGCVGVLSCVINRLLDNPRHHVVIEANPTLIEILARNRDNNSCSFIIENCILSRDTEGSFFVSELMTANRKDSNQGRKIAVQTKTVEDLVESHGFAFDSLILDIEGGEFDFFKENAKLLGNLNLVVLELHQNILSDAQIESCRSMLESAGLHKVDQLDETEVWVRLSKIKDPVYDK